VSLSEAKVHAAEQALKQTQADLARWEATVAELSQRYREQNLARAPYDQLNQAQKKVNTYRQRLPRRQKGLQQAIRRLTRHQLRAHEAAQHVAELQTRYQQLSADNAANPRPVRITIRLDAGFTSREHIAWLIEMGYDLYTRGRFPKVRRTLIDALTDQTVWTRVGAKAEMTTWADTTLDDYFIYPLNIALLRHRNAETNTYSSLLHYGHTDAATDPDRWFHTYNGRQTIEAGIKEGKTVFQMHHFKVRAPQALRLQEHFAVFAANFVRFAGVALNQQFPDLPFNSQSVKEVVQVAAHTSAQVEREGETWILTFTPQSYYANFILHFGGTVLQLPLPLLLDIHFLHF
jgi:hypothetical protein